MMVPSLRYSPGSTDNSSIDKAETSLDWQEYFSQLQDTTDALPCHIHLPVCLWIMNPHSRALKKNTSHGNDVLPQDTTHLIQKTCYQRGSPCQDPAGICTTRRPSWRPQRDANCNGMVMFPFVRSGQNHLARHSERGKKTRLTEEEVGRQHQGMDRRGVRQVPEGSGEEGKMVKTGRKIICGAPSTLAVKELMMMMMMIMRQAQNTDTHALNQLGLSQNSSLLWSNFTVDKHIWHPPWAWM